MCLRQVHDKSGHKNWYQRVDEAKEDGTTGLGQYQQFERAVLFFEGDRYGRHGDDAEKNGYGHHVGPQCMYAVQALDGEVPEAAEPIQAAVVQALAWAFSWVEMLESGQVKSISELARSLEVDGSYVTRILKLTALAPDIVEAIINGEETEGLSLAKLIAFFPEDWREQRRFFGVEDNCA
jgi:hypothetical protein